MASSAAGERRLIWDLPVRLAHLGLILGVAGAWISHYAGAQYFAVHEWCGYGTLILAVFRVLWGFVGTRHARFKDFLHGPRTLLRCLAVPGDRSLGHNPLGGWMIVVLLALIAAVSATGLFANDQIMNAGPLYGYTTGERSDGITTWHRYLAWISAAAIGIHVGAALFYLWIKKQDLMTPMVTGWKSNPHPPIDAGIKSSRTGLAIVIVAILAGCLFYWLERAPPANL